VYLCVWAGKDMPIYCTHECIRVPESLPSPIYIYIYVYVRLSRWAKVFVFIWRLRLLHVWQKLLNPCGFLEQQVHSVTISLNPAFPTAP